MDGTRFDRIAKHFAANRVTRRKALAAAGDTGLLAALNLDARRPQAQTDATPEATPVAVPGDSTEELLFVQGFRSGSLTPKEGSDDECTLTLEDGLGYTVYFTDRPERQFGAVPTARFLDGLGFGEENPPNAALVMEVNGEEEVVVLELMTPAFSASSMS